MTGQVCKAAICDDEAESRLMNACAKIESIKDASIDLRIKHSEVYIKYMDKAQAVADKLVFDSGE